VHHRSSTFWGLTIFMEDNIFVHNTVPSYRAYILYEFRGKAVYPSIIQMWCMQEFEEHSLLKTVELRLPFFLEMAVRRLNYISWLL